MSQKHQEGTAIYDLQRDLHYSTQTAKNILQSLAKNGIIEVRLPAKGDSLRGRKPYTLTHLGREIARLMEYLQKEKIISEDNDLDLVEAFRQNSDQVLKLEQAGFSIEMWEKAISCGLITEKRKTVSQYVYGQSIDPSTPEIPLQVRLELYSYSID
jgi:DNA-binding PadR family transcriptional regulator